MNYRIGEISFEYQNDGHCLNDIRLDDCSKITSITILSNIKEIGPYVFYNCYNLKSIIIPTSVTKIHKYAFSIYFNQLKTLIIPPSVIEIEDDAIDPTIDLLILPKKFFKYCSVYRNDIDDRILKGTRYKYEWEDYKKRRKTFYYEDQKLDIMLNNLSQLKQYCPFLNQIDNEDKSSNKTLLQAYKNVSQKYPILFKEFEKEVLRLNPNFKFE